MKFISLIEILFKKNTSKPNDCVVRTFGQDTGIIWHLCSKQREKSLNTLGAVERGEINIAVDNIKKLALALEIGICEFFEKI